MDDKSTQQAAFEKKARVERKLIYAGRTISVHTDTLKQEGHPPRNWDIVVHPGAVVIVPVADDGRILLVKQWRRAVQEILLELPAGTLEKGEPADVCALRELQEETGFKAREMVSLGGFYTAPGFCTEYLYLFLARGLEEAPLDADEDEAIDLVYISLEEAWQWIAEGKIHDAKTIAGVARYGQWTQQ